MKYTAKEVLDWLFEKRDKQHKEVQKIDIAIRALQAICDHDLVDDGHDSHKDHYKCSICRHTESW